MIRNLLIDLGAVIYRIDPARTTAALLARMPAHAPPDARALPDWEGVRLLETDAITPQQFRDKIRTDFGLLVTDAEIDAAWNALLLGPEPGMDAVLAALALRYDMALLSNTNRIHAAVFLPQCEALFRPFRACLMSYDLKLRKPDPRIFHEALSRMGWQAAETLFIDDNAANIATAAALGIHTHLYHDPAFWDQL